MLTESVDVLIDDSEWAVAYRDKTERLRNSFNSLRDRRATSQERFNRDTRNAGSTRGQASLSNGVHRRCNKRSLYAAQS